MANALVTTVVDEPMDFVVYANNPADMVGAQKSMILWCARKIQAIRAELEEAKTQLDAAVAHKWSPAGWRTQVGRLESRHVPVDQRPGVHIGRIVAARKSRGGEGGAGPLQRAVDRRR